MRRQTIIGHRWTERDRQTDGQADPRRSPGVKYRVKIVSPQKTVRETRKNVDDAKLEKRSGRLTTFRGGGVCFCFVPLSKHVPLERHCWRTRNETVTRNADRSRINLHANVGKSARELGEQNTKSHDTTVNYSGTDEIVGGPQNVTRGASVRRSLPRRRATRNVSGRRSVRYCQCAARQLLFGRVLVAGGPYRDGAVMGSRAVRRGRPRSDRGTPTAVGDSSASPNTGYNVRSDTGTGVVTVRL